MPIRPERLVILGANGFVGSALKTAAAREDIPILQLCRSEVDLLDSDAGRALAAYLRPTDTLVSLSAVTPCNDHDAFEQNIQMMDAICFAIAQSKPSHVIYFSTDAVYSNSSDPLSEASPTSPDTYYGSAHLTRETMLRSVAGEFVVCLRSTAIFGPGHPSPKYGPNRFIESALRGDDVYLFGAGEECRDHVFIDDAVEIILKTARHRSVGVLNIASGNEISFKDLASIVLSCVQNSVSIRFLPRSGPMPFDGRRVFDTALIRRVFPDFSYSDYETALRQTISRIKADRIERPANGNYPSDVS